MSARLSKVDRAALTTILTTSPPETVEYNVLSLFSSSITRSQSPTGKSKKNNKSLLGNFSLPKLRSELQSDGDFPICDQMANLLVHNGAQISKAIEDSVMTESLSITEVIRQIVRMSLKITKNININRNKFEFILF